MTIRKGWLIGTAVAVVAFGAGWLGAKVSDFNKIPVGQVFAYRWIAGVGTLVQNPRTLQFSSPEQVSSLIRNGLSIDTIELSRYYDHLSPQWKGDVVFLFPSARAIAAKGGNSHLHSTRLGIFIDCVQQVQAHGGSVNKCTSAKKIWAR